MSDEMGWSRVVNGVHSGRGHNERKNRPHELGLYMKAHPHRFDGGIRLAYFNAQVDVFYTTRLVWVCFVLFTLLRDVFMRRVDVLEQH